MRMHEFNERTVNLKEKQCINNTRTELLSFGLLISTLE